MMRFVIGILVGVVVAACDRSVSDTPTPSGPAPEVSVSLGFGEPPLEGVLSLAPGAESANWGYSIDLDEDGQVDHEGVLEREIGFAYRFVTPGVHHIAVELSGPDGNQT